MDKRIVVFLAVALFGFLSASDECAASGDAAATWRNAPKLQSSWSREDLVDPLCTQNKLDGMPREKVLSIFGIPDYSSETPAIAFGHASRSDEYQTSMKNTSSFRIDYDDKDRVSKYSKEGGGCVFSYFLGPAPAKSAAQTIDRIKALLLNNHAGTQLSQIKAILGKPDYEQSNIPPSFPTSSRTSLYCWRAAADGRTCFLAGTSGQFNQELDKRLIDSFSVIRLSQDCPVKRP